MHKQPMNLLLELPINLVKHVEAQHVFADNYLVSVMQETLRNGVPVQQRAVSRTKIDDPIADLLCNLIALSINAGMETRRARIVNSNISLEGPSENDFVTLQR